MLLQNPRKQNTSKIVMLSDRGKNYNPSTRE